MNRHVAVLLCLPLSILGAALPLRAQHPADRFADVERRLLQADRVAADFHITSEGAFEADLRGRLEISPEALSLTARGHFGGQSAELFVARNGEEFRWGNASGAQTDVVPEHLQEAILIGMTRMGLLHNLAMLTAGAPPDHADGGVAEWVMVEGLRAVEGDPTAVGFDIVVSGQPSGSATLSLDAAGRPVVRRQTVRFPEGEMLVIERYQDVRIDDGAASTTSPPGAAREQETEMIERVTQFAERYTAAWNSGDPAAVAAFYAPGAALKVNDAEPAVGREAVTGVARGFMEAFPDLELLFDGIEQEGDRYRYHWTFIGTNTGPGGTGKRVHFSGYEAWRIGEGGLIADSLGHFDAEEYARQLAHGVDSPTER